MLRVIFNPIADRIKYLDIQDKNEELESMKKRIIESVSHDKIQQRPAKDVRANDSKVYLITNFELRDAKISKPNDAEYGKIVNYFDEEDDE